MDGLFAAALALSTVTGIAASDTPPGPDKLTAASCEAFGFDFYRQLATTPGYRGASDKNIAISPVSLATVLEVLRLGATGESNSQLTKVLHAGAGQAAGAGAAGIGKSEAINSNGVTFSMANSLWIDLPFHPKETYLHAVDSEFGDAVFSLDFKQPEKAAARIDGWISDNTAGHIKDLLSAGDLPPSTAMIAANAVYFKGQWQTPFDVKRTADEPFQLASGKETPVKMMHRTGRLKFAEVDGVKVLELPYAGAAVNDDAEFSMVLLLPDAGSAAMAHLEGQLTGPWLAAALANFRSQRVNVAIPRFTFTCEPKETISILKALGLTQIFKPSADFAPISDKGSLYVGLFKHRAWLEVNEEGTKAAAATATGMMAAAVHARPAEFIADHPFLFVIQARDTPLFVGRVSNPAGK